MAQKPSGKPTILQIINVDPDMQPHVSDPFMIALALCRTDKGTEIFGVDRYGKLFILGAN